MNILIVLANPNPLSFNRRMGALAAKTLESAGHSVVTLDLYNERFFCELGVHDFEHEVDRNNFDYKMHQKIAAERNSFAPAIRESQRLLTESNVVIFQFPLWWFSMPAILKNWIDKTFAFDFAYNGRKNRWFSNGPFREKRAMLSVTTSGPQGTYTDQGINGDIERVLWPIHNGILNFTGFRVLRPFIFWSSDKLNEDAKTLYELAFVKRLQRLEESTPLPFHPLECFGADYRLIRGSSPRARGRAS